MSDKNCFCFTCMKPVNLNGMVCEYCFGSDWQCPDENDKDALRAWLDPWHPASEPPERLTTSNESRKVLVSDGRHCRDDFYVHAISGGYWDSGTWVTMWCEMPPLPKES
jgi:hypothetical protein